MPPTINSREDLLALVDTPAYDEALASLAGTLWRFEKDDVVGAWAVVEDDSTIERFGLTRADFPDAAPPPLPEYVAPSAIDLAAYARDVSWRTRVAGTTIGGISVGLDGDSIALINGMASLAERDNSRTFSFDSNTGTISLTADAAIAFAEAVGEWVQLTFDRRGDVLAAIAAGDVSSTEEIDAAFADVTAPWPVA